MTDQKFNAEITGNIEEMIFSTNLSRYAAEVEKIIAYAKNNELNMEDVLEELFEGIQIQYLLDLEDMEDITYECLRNDYAVRMFLFTDWAFYRKENRSATNTSYIKKLFSAISHNAHLKIDNEKTERAVNEMLDLVRAQIDLFAMIPDDQIN